MAWCDISIVLAPDVVHQVGFYGFLQLEEVCHELVSIVNRYFFHTTGIASNSPEQVLKKQLISYTAFLFFLDPFTE